MATRPPSSAPTVHSSRFFLSPNQRIIPSIVPPRLHRTETLPAEITRFSRPGTARESVHGVTGGGGGADNQRRYSAQVSASPDREFSVNALVDRVRRAPAEHLGARSPASLDKYVTGYECALRHYSGGPLVDEVGAWFHNWVNDRIDLTQEHASRLNARNCISPGWYALMLSEDEHEAFETYIKLRESALADARTAGADAGVVCSALQDQDGSSALFDVLRLVLKRPEMYFDDVMQIWALISGFRWAEHDLEIRSIEAARMDAFQSWVDERYPFGRGQIWARTFRFLAMNVGPRSLHMFREHLEMFLSGGAPDSPDPGMETMLKSIVEYAETLKNDDSDDEA